MKLKLHNINKIKRASIELGGLTLIAGENDSGKSTIGKVLFSMIKALSRQSEDLEEGKEKTIFILIEKIFFTIRKYYPIDNIDNNTFRSLFYPPTFAEELRVFLSLSEISSDSTKRQLRELLGYRIQFISSLQMPSHQKDTILLYLDRIYESCLRQQDPVKTFSMAFEKALYSEFYSKICSNLKNDSTIELDLNEEKITVTIKSNSVKSVQMDTVLFQPFEDVTFIETPMYLQLTHLLERAGTLFYDEEGLNRFSPKIPLHIKDLVKKLELSRYATDNDNDEYSKFINSIIHGKFLFDKKNNQFLFVKDDGISMPLQPSNVASGIKSFGIIQLLLKVNELNKHKILIIDEPENHLHPKWQLLFAHLIVKLVKNKIPVVLSTHSPYFIQAVKYYSHKEEISSRVKYYLADIDDIDSDMTNIIDVSADLNKIFIKLAEPLNEILGE